ncbi:Site-specific recombinase XerD [Mucilaginibacter pineti]|uniref:Site-specific recombinase XerD n=1 Tax=Mucilaginibacter pineti TaxID=1391627 RepID=A0A1G6V8Z4_9SPHI|nr:site-specific integrase [Mucilaginibacter pineti]SDD49306.1 Site-specific recombinase XerD [Mucilaginibacter pineti]
MITYKIVLDERRAKTDGKFPIMFRITFNRKTSNYSSGIALKKEHWNAQASLINSTCPNFKELNKSVASKFLKIQKLILKLDDEGTFSFETFKELLNDHFVPQTKSKSTVFLAYANQLISEMIEEQRAGNASVYQTAVNRVINFSGDKNLLIDHIDYTFIDKFKRQLVKEGVKPNTVGNYLRSIRAIWNKAIKSKLVDRSLYPFLDISIKTERTAKRALNVEDLIKFFNTEYKQKTAKWHARNYFLLSFSLRGASFIDLAFLTNINIFKGRINYERQKTGSKLSIKLIPIVENILNYYKGTSEHYLLPIFPHKLNEGSVESKKVSRQWIKTTNKWLKRIAIDCGIDGEVTSYVTRHTWATTAKKLGYSNEVIAECLGHEYGNKITNIYLDCFDQSLIDEVNAKVIQLIE